MEELIYNFANKIIPKKKCAVLTFDDGYKCHYDIVYPILKKEKNFWSILSNQIYSLNKKDY